MWVEAQVGVRVGVAAEQKGGSHQYPCQSRHRRGPQQHRRQRRRDDMRRVDVIPGRLFQPAYRSPAGKAPATARRRRTPCQQGRRRPQRHLRLHRRQRPTLRSPAARLQPRQQRLARQISPCASSWCDRAVNVSRAPPAAGLGAAKACAASSFTAAARSGSARGRFSSSACTLPDGARSAEMCQSAGVPKHIQHGLYLFAAGLIR